MTIHDLIALAHRRTATRLLMARHAVWLSDAMRTYRPGHV